MNYLLKSVTTHIYPVLHLEFIDGFAGDLDLANIIANGKFFEPLKDPTFFRNVKMDDDGYAFGWKLDEIGGEIDFSAEGARIDIETALADKTALAFRAKIQAAE